MELRIVFMGTPEFAVPSLRALVEAGYRVVGVITATDKRGGRGGKKLLESPVKQYAISQDIPVLQPKNLKASEFVEALRDLQATLQIVVAFRMLPAVVWQMPELGTFNLHGSLLPKYRGAAPINWAIIRGEQETGVTTFFLKQEIDTGNIILQEALPIHENDTAGDVHDRMMKLGAATVLRTVQLIENDQVEVRAQNDATATSAPKIFHDTCAIDFNAATRNVHNFIRGLSPYPAAWTLLDGAKCKILRTTFELSEHDHAPGTWLTDQKKLLKIACVDGYVHVHRLQLQGRRRMDAPDFLNGYTLENAVAV